MIRKLLARLFQDEIDHLALQQYSVFLSDTVRNRQLSHRESRSVQREHIRVRQQMMRLT